MSRKFEYIGSGSTFEKGDKLQLRNDNHFMIEKLVEDNIIKIGEQFEFVEWKYYAYGMNWFSVKNKDFTLPELCCDKIN